ncbi:hypothetical protein A6P39_037835 [Streptomyces sp. FXJ1.172]|nr:hypothetical protein [Streptomyces sp. FXJ1.172]WEO99338.1 hypothetical protein A6P39_037835 [Streptomyces sp. FXJ1.172]
MAGLHAAALVTDALCQAGAAPRGSRDGRGGGAGRDGVSHL